MAAATSPTRISCVFRYLQWIREARALESAQATLRLHWQTGRPNQSRKPSWLLLELLCAHQVYVSRSLLSEILLAYEIQDSNSTEVQVGQSGLSAICSYGRCASSVSEKRLAECRLVPFRALREWNHSKSRADSWCRFWCRFDLQIATS